MKSGLHKARLALSVIILCFFSNSALAQCDAWNVELLRQIGGPCLTVFVQENYASISEGPNLRILDIGNPSNPQSLGKVLLPDIVKDVHVSGDYAYAAAANAGFTACPSQSI